MHAHGLLGFPSREEPATEACAGGCQAAVADQRPWALVTTLNPHTYTTHTWEGPPLGWRCRPPPLLVCGNPSPPTPHPTPTAHTGTHTHLWDSDALRRVLDQHAAQEVAAVGGQGKRRGGGAGAGV